MTVLEFWGCALVTFGPGLAMFSLTIAKDPIKVILLISSSFFWLMSFLLTAICWSVISMCCDYLVVGAYIAVFSQELFRYLFHRVAKKAQEYVTKMTTNKDSSSRTNEIQISSGGLLEEGVSIGYVSGLGFGLMNAAFSMMNVLTDLLGPGTVGLKGDTHFFIVVSAVTALAFILLNVAWSVLMAASIEKSDKRLAFIALITHLIATTITFINRLHLQLISVVIVYLLAALCGLGAFQVAGFNLKSIRSRT